MKEKRIEKQKKIEELYIELKIMEQQIKAMQEHIKMISTHIGEIETTKENLKSFGKIQINSEILASIAPGIFLKARLIDNQELAVNVGGGIVVKKSINEVTSMLDRQLAELHIARERAVLELQNLGAKAESIERSIIQAQKAQK